MSSNKMLIDATHPEETRVMVVRGNRIEEFDFESQEKRQLRGNIYLAKVTRVEPSLQAAFVDYGGNRHGFLAFSEIHPDYYQIPVADRQALLEQEAEEARASAADDDEDEPARKKPSRARKRQASKEKGKKRSSKAAESTENEDNAVNAEASLDDAEANTESTGTAETEVQAEEVEARPAETGEDADSEANDNARKDEAAVEDEPDDGDSDDTDDDNPKIISAIVETDEISEPLPGEGDDDEPDSVEDAAEEASEDKKTGEVKKKKRTTRRKPSTSRKNKKSEEEEPVDASDPENARDEEPVAAEADKEPEPAIEQENGEEQEDDEDEDVESVGQEDALEEVPERRRNRRRYKIQEVIKRRQVLLVQVVKEERGTKGAALTTYLSLAGRYSVLMPNTARGGGISRKITNAADRKRLKAIASELEVPEGMGVILRTAGASRTKVEIKRDFEYLMRMWEQVRNLTLSSTAPCLVYEEGSLIKRSIRDLYDKDTAEVLVAGETGYAEAREFMSMLMPSHAKKVKLYTEDQSIYSKFGIDAQLEKMVSPQVTLKSGGYLVINQTEALVSVDVNSGRATREHSIEDTALKTNLEAAEEVARQLRLRDLAGLIVIDFIDMEEKRNNRAVEKKLKDCLKHDRARIQVGRISHFGLLEMSRQRLRASVLESTMDACPHCGGTGFVRSESAIALHVFRAIEEHVVRHHKNNVVVKTTPAIAMHILNYKKSALAELESRFGLMIIIEGDATVQGQQFEIQKGSEARAPDGAPAVQVDAGERSGDEADNRGRKRTRRRKKSDKASEDAKPVAESDSETENEAEDVAAAEDGEHGEKPKRKRRRGSRGGKKKQDEETIAETSDSAEDKTDEATANQAGEQAKSSGRRNTRRRGTSRAKEVPAEQESEGDVKQEAAEVESEAPKPRRRTTRRKSPAEETDAEQGQTETQDTAAAKKDDGPKKTGWWSSEGGFF